jgi:iron complex outermembrane receptor protein
MVDGIRGGLSWQLANDWQLAAQADGSDTFFNNPGPESEPYSDPRQGSGDIHQRAVELSLDGGGAAWTARLKLYHNYVHNDFYQAGNTRARDYGLRLAGEIRRPGYSLKGGFDLERYGGNFSVNGSPDFVPVDAYDLNAAPYLMGKVDLSSRLGLAGGLRVSCSDRYVTEWVPQIRLWTKIAPRSMMTLSAAKGFKNPSVAQQYLPFYAGDRTLLAPERMWQYELGLARNGERWDTSLALFLAEGDNLIRQVATGWPPLYDNSGSFLHRGIELTARGRLNEAAGFTLSATWILERDDQTLATPAAAYRIDTWLCPCSSLQLDLSLTTELDRFGDDYARAALPDLTLVSAGLAWELPWQICAGPTARSELFASATNLTDRQYRIFADYPMPRLTYVTGLRLSR